MANIAEYLNKIQTAVYGEEVRGSIYNAIDLINKVGEVTLTLGTAVTSTSSPTSGYYDKSVYINTNTWDMWRCTGSAWVKAGNLLGSSIGSVKNTGKKADTNDLVDIYHIYTDNNVDIGSFEVANGPDLVATKTGNNLHINFYYADGKVYLADIKDGAKITVGTAVTATNSTTYNVYQDDLYLNTNTWDLWKCTTASGTGTGTGWSKVGNIKGAQGIQGVRGYDFAGLELKSTSGLVKTYNVKSSNGTVLGTIDISDGIQGIQGINLKEIKYKSTSGAVDTYEAILSDNTSGGNFQVANGRSVRVYKGGISGHATPGNTSTCDLSMIFPPDNLAVGDGLIAQWVPSSTDTDYKNYNIILEFWQITEINTTTATVTALTEYPISKGTLIQASKTDNIVTIETSDSTGSARLTLQDGSKIGYGSDTINISKTNVINGITYYNGDYYISTYNWEMWKCNGTNSWNYVGIVKGEAGSKILTYKGTSEITGDNPTISFDLINTHTGSINRNDILLATYPLEDTTSNSAKVDIWLITDVDSVNRKVSLTIQSSTYIKTGATGPQGTSIDNVSLVSKNNRTSTYRVNLNSGDSAGTFEVLDGETGPQGFSPTISESKAGIVTTVTVTDANGTHTFEIQDGQSGDGTGDMLKAVYDEDGDGVLDIDSIPVCTDEDIREMIARNRS